MRIVNTDITMQSEHRASRSARVVNTTSGSPGGAAQPDGRHAVAPV